ncbi:MAG: GNAT family N-acetyltransferase [Armatimonadota bacterium]
MQIVPFELSMTEQVIALWNKCIGEHYPMTERLFRQNVLGDPFSQREGNLVALEGNKVVGWILARCLIDVPPELSNYKGRASIGALCVDPEFRGRGIANALYGAAESFLKSQGSTSVSVVHYPYHLTPGVPSEAMDLKVFLERRGFGNWHETYDLRRQLHDYEIPPEVLWRLKEQNPQVEIRPAKDGEQRAIVEFVGREFPGGWHYDTKRFFEKGGDPSDIVIAIERDEIIGFCHTFIPESIELRGSTHWFPLLQGRWGGLGPIGIAAAHRGRGLGLALLCYSVWHNKQRGVTDMVIDWTDLVDFYGRIGFKIWKRYWQGSKTLT